MLTINFLLFSVVEVGIAVHDISPFHVKKLVLFNRSLGFSLLIELYFYFNILFLFSNTIENLSTIHSKLLMKLKYHQFYTLSMILNIIPFLFPNTIEKILKNLIYVKIKLISSIFIHFYTFYFYLFCRCHHI